MKTHTNHTDPDAPDPDPSDEKLEWARAVRALNDAFRINFTATELYLSPNLLQLSIDDQEQILNAVRKFRRFSEKSDPAMIHHQGFFRHGELDIVWTIYHHDGEVEHPEPHQSLDLDLSKRWMMIMTAEEWWEDDLPENLF